MEEVFLSILSSDQGVVNQATHVILEHMEDPAFLGFMVEMLAKADRTQVMLIKAISISILQMVKVKYNSDFFPMEFKAGFAGKIGELLFSIPYETRPHLMEIVPILRMDQVLDLSGLITYCYQQVEAFTNASDVATSLGIISEDMYSSLILHLVPLPDPSFFQAIVTVIARIGEPLLANLENEICAACWSSIAKITKTIFDSYRILQDMFQMGELFAIMKYLIIVLKTTTYSQLRIDILSCIWDAILKCGNRETQAFAAPFGSTAIPEVIESLMLCFSNSPPPNERTWLLRVVLVLIEAGFGAGFLNPFFIDNVMLPSCLLTEEDIENFNELPEHYLTFCYGIGSTAIESPRKAVSAIIEAIAKLQIGPQVLDMILERAAVEKQNPMEFEASLYLVGCIVKRHHRQTDAALGEVGLKCIQSDNPFLIATGVFILTNMKMDQQQCNNISVTLLLQCPCLVVQMLSLDLFSASYDSTKTAFGYPLAAILERLLQLMNTVSDTRPRTILDLFVRQYPEEIQPIAGQMIQTLLEGWRLCGDDDDDEDMRRSFLDRACLVITQLPCDSPILIEMTEFIVSFCCQAIQAREDPRSDAGLIDVINTLASRLTDPPQILYHCIDVFVAYFTSSFEEAAKLVDDVKVLFITFISKPNFAELEEGRFASSIMGICQVCLTSMYNSYVIASAFLIMTAFVETNPASTGTVCSAAAQFIKMPGLPDVLFASALILLSSGLMVNPAAVTPLLDPEAIEIITQRATIIIAIPLKYMRRCFIGMCTLARGGIPNAFLAAGALIPHLVNKERMEEATEKDDEEQLGEQREMDFGELGVPDADLPNCPHDLRDVFNETATATQWFGELAPELQAFITTAFHK